MDAVSHKIFLLRVSREQRDDIHSSRILAPITPSVQLRLSAQLQPYNPALELCRLKVLRSTSAQTISSNIQSIEPNVFYVPKMTNQKAFDSFVLLDDFLYIFQITVGMWHDINHELIDVADKYSFPPRHQWRFVFIIPPNMTLTVPQPQRLTLQGLFPYSAVVDVEPVQVQ